MADDQSYSHGRWAARHIVALPVVGVSAAADDLLGHFRAFTAIKVLEVARQHHPYSQEILSALVSYYRESGDQAKALRVYEELNNLQR